VSKPKKPRKNKTIVFRPGTNIGHISAEADDEFLFPCFVDNPALSTVTDLENSKMLIAGRTGAGKTALIKKIAHDKQNASEIDLSELAMSYVSNSDIIQFLSALNIDLDLLFQALWKHIFCLEYIRCKFEVKNEQQSSSLFKSLHSFFSGDKRKSYALDYLEKWQNKFWITMDENIKEIIQKIEDSIDAELGAEVGKFKSRAGYASSLSKEKRM